MDNGMQKNALLLEQCRDEMKTLSIRGDKALRDALFQADKQVRDCTREYKQAERALNLTTEQQHTVEEVYANGKERLALAMAAEDDARIAAETVTRMIDDASTVCNMANKDTIKIMKRANDVLMETARRAQVS